MDLVEVGWGDVDWIGLAQNRDRLRSLVNSVLNLRVINIFFLMKRRGNTN
jgi:hypothetical protein